MEIAGSSEIALGLKVDTRFLGGRAIAWVRVHPDTISDKLRMPMTMVGKVRLRVLRSVVEREQSPPAKVPK